MVEHSEWDDQDRSTWAGGKMVCYFQFGKLSCDEEPNPVQIIHLPKTGAEDAHCRMWNRDTLKECGETAGKDFMRPFHPHCT